MNTPPRTPEQEPRRLTTPPPPPRLQRTITEETVIDRTLPVPEFDIENEAMDFEDEPPPTPLVRQNAVYGNNAAAAAAAAAHPAGIAFEIHNRADKINPERVISTYERVMNRPRQSYSLNIDAATLNAQVKQFIWDRFRNGILVNRRFSREAKPEKWQDFTVLFNRKIRDYDFTQDMNELLMILFSVDYILDFNKSDLLRQLYIDSFLTDCITAYAPTSDRYSGMSCVGGTIERLYTSAADAIEQRLLEPNVGRYILSAKQKEQYQQVYLAFKERQRIMEELNRATIEWFSNIEDAENIPTDVNARKRMLVEHIIQHMNREGFSGFGEETPEFAEYIETNQGWLNDAISRNPPVMGGKNRNKKTYKNKKQTKRRRVMKSRKSSRK